MSIVVTRRTINPNKNKISAVFSIFFELIFLLRIARKDKMQLHIKIKIATITKSRLAE